MTQNLEGKTAIVTGASRGIGKAIALELARNGANVVICARTEQIDPKLPGTLGQTEQEIAAFGGKTLAVRADISKDDDLRAVVTRALEEFGKVDILVDNAAYSTQHRFLESSIDDLDQGHRMNVRAPYLLTQLVAPSMIESGGGAIFNITSGAANPGTGSGGGWRPSPIYSLTKAALDRTTTALAAELHDQNIAVIAVNPGYTLTERMKLNTPADQLRPGNTPEDTAQTIAVLAEDPMKYTGQIINTSEFRSQS